METRLSAFSEGRLRIDAENVCQNLVNKLNKDILHILNRKGAVVGISGGIDSSVTLALAVGALGPDNVVGIILPERDSSPESQTFAQRLAAKFKVKTIVEDITDALKGFGCYRRRDEAIARVIPGFDPSADKAKIVIKQNIENNIPAIFSVVAISPSGKQQSRLLPAKEYLEIVAATNFKQRTRMSMLYFHAERLHYAVVGTPNKHEVEQGFFVKHGDGAADIMPIGGLYKTQVYQLAEYLGIPAEIIKRTPTTDTYTAEQTQEEFFYQLPFGMMDLLWHAWENKYPSEVLAEELDKSVTEIQNIYNSFERKKKTTDYLRMAPVFYK